MKRLLMLIMVVCLAACGESPSPDDEAQNVSLLLNWYPEMEHGGYYAALVNGYYEEAGLDVDIQRGGVDVPVIQLVATGKATFGIANADDVLLGRAQGAEIVAVMAPIQMSPRCILARPDTGIDSFEDISNITLAMSSRAPFSHYLRKKLPLENVQIVGYPGSVAPLVAGTIQAMQGYSFSEPFVAKQNGLDATVLMVSDLGFNPYTSVLFTREEIVRNNPDLVRRMVEQSIRGWQNYSDNPFPANERINQVNPEMTPEILAFGAEVLKPMIATDQGVGSMSEERWTKLADQLVECELVQPGKVEPKSAYTLEFLR